MPELLFKTTDRDESHRKLEEVLAEGKHPKAECREDGSSEEPYEVWSGSEGWEQTPLSEEEKRLMASPLMEGDMLDVLAEKLLERMAAGARAKEEG